MVGYKKVELGANAMDILGQCFVKEGTSIQDIVPSGDFNLEGGDWIMWWNPENGGKYTKAYYFGEDVDGVFDPADPSYGTQLGAGWGDLRQFFVDGSIPAGKGFWSQAYDGGSLILSGEVTSDGTVTLGANAMDLVCNPFPVDTDIQDIVPGGDFNQEGGDWIMWWNPENGGSYSKAYYFGEDVDGVFDPADPSYGTPLGAGWGDLRQFKVEGLIPAGKGFWSQAYDGGSLTFHNPVDAQ